MPVERYEITDVTQIRIGSTDCWQVRQRRPDGEHHVTVFPASTLEWRAAEYDVDHTTPEGLASILDMVLHEPFLPDPIEHRSQDPAAAKGLTAPSTQAMHGLAIGDDAPITLHNAPDRATARAAHLERIEQAKRTRVHVVTPAHRLGKTSSGQAAARPAPDPLAVIRTAHGITAEGVAAKTALVEQARQQLAANITGTPPPARGPASFPETFTTTMWDAAVPRRDQAHQASSGEPSA
ncbi:hypothetical protein [Streptomyces sp. CB01881]|uniref:hypothetical protein n=1 Tax=Streptomyces sp. CB01881 TaxID=2078691 RepID=UPI000CDBF5C7|nr:hypothetical protein [Streptomyces sp. CB01881]AUY50450.1 hypothetical protein C2142_17615 [Streptomyces sp. CB01881]TYC73837.1 hypothetical protein EH183_17595 [Streptomyces sp. CB01881]